MKTTLNLDREWLETGKARLRARQKTQKTDLLSVDFYNAATVNPIQSKSSDMAMLEAAKGNILAVVNIKGALSYSSSWLSEFFGYTAYDKLTAQLGDLVNNSKVSTILLRIQSPGGEAIGASEMSELIYNARSKKRIIAYSDPYAFSAAYQIGTAASEFYGAPSGMVGSVGSYIEHVEYSKMLENEGISVTYISAGAKKVDGNPSEPLSESAKADMQEEVNFFYEQFVNDVARNRNVSAEFVKENFGQGARVLNKNGLHKQMLDGIMSLNELLEKEIFSIQQSQKSAQAFSLAKNMLTEIALEDLD